jgi:hypothetical protein
MVLKKEGSDVAEQVVMLHENSDWPVPVECRLVEDRALIAEPRGTYTDEELLKDPEILPPIPEIRPTLDERVTDLETRVTNLEGSAR